MSSYDETIKLIMELGKTDPALQAEIDKALNGGRVAATYFKAEVDRAAEEQHFSGREIIFGVMMQAVMLSYIEHSGNRGAARDDLSNLLDDLFTNVEDGAIKSGVIPILKEMQAAKERGDFVAMGRLNAKVKQMREDKGTQASPKH